MATLPCERFSARREDAKQLFVDGQMGGTALGLFNLGAW
jgi:hypothetical protein